MSYSKKLFHLPVKVLCNLDGYYANLARLQDRLEDYSPRFIKRANRELAKRLWALRNEQYALDLLELAYLDDVFSSGEDSSPETETNIFSEFLTEQATETYRMLKALGLYIEGELPYMGFKINHTRLEMIRIDIMLNEINQEVL